LKVALALHHKLLPPTFECDDAQRQAAEAGLPVLRQYRTGAMGFPALPACRAERLLSSFGFRGTNFHAVVEEYQGDFQDPRTAPPRRTGHPSCFLERG